MGLIPPHFLGFKIKSISISCIMVWLEICLLIKKREHLCSFIYKLDSDEGKLFFVVCFL